MKKRFLLTFLLGCICTHLLCAEEISIKTYFTPSTVAIGERGSFSLVVSGTSFPKSIDLPRIHGLQFGYVGKSHSIQIINGLKRTQVTHNYWVISEKEGTFVFPDTPISIDGNEYIIEGSLLTVVAQKENAALGNLSPTLQVHIGKKNPFAGEVVPVSVTLKAPDGVEGRILPPNHPIQKGDSFVDHGFNLDPQSASMIENNVHYKTYTWETAITPIKIGPQKLQYEIPLALTLTREQHRTINSIFDQHLNSMFGNFVREEREVLIKTSTLSIDALSLPEEGKPESFSGAIGTFNLEKPELSSSKAEVGEPITLSLNINGQGNFDRIGAPELKETRQFKSYTPKMSFKAKDTFGIEGSLTLEYIIIPQQPGVLEINNFKFSFFDPEQKIYIEKAITPAAIEITGTSPSTTKPLPSFTKNTPSGTTSDNQLLPIKLETKKFKQKITPIYTSPWFYIANTFLALICLSWIFFRKRYLKRTENPEFYIKIQIQKNTERHLKAAHEAANKHEVELFLGSAQKALRLSIMRMEQSINHDAITWKEMEPEIRKKVEDPILMHYIKEIFESADAIKYGKQSWDKKSILDEYDKLNKCIQLLAKK